MTRRCKNWGIALDGVSAKIEPRAENSLKRRMTVGIGLREIARNMNIPEGTVLARAKREGWSQQIQSAKALIKRGDALAVTPAEAVAATLAERGERHLKRMAGVSERGVDHIETMDGPEILNSLDRLKNSTRLRVAPSA